MDTKRALDYQAHGVARIQDAYSSAKSFRSPAVNLHAKLAAILDEMRARNVPQWAIHYVKGYSQALMDSLYRHDLVYGGFRDGVFYSTHRDRPDYYERHGISARDFATDGTITATGHYWAADTSRPFFTGQEPKALKESTQ